MGGGFSFPFPRPLLHVGRRMNGQRGKKGVDGKETRGPSGQFEVLLDCRSVCVCRCVRAEPKKPVAVFVRWRP